MDEVSKIKLFEIASQLVLQDAKERCHPSIADNMAEKTIEIYQKLLMGFIK